MSKSSYPYTLQPIRYDISEAEQRNAQLKIWRKNNNVSKTAWIVIAIAAVIAIASLIFLQGYSTAFSWVILAGILIYFLVKKIGLEWYVKRQMKDTPVANIEGIRLGVQPHGLVMQQKIGAQAGVATVSWTDIYEWYDTDEFLLVSFRARDQQGAYILPNRLDSKNFSFDTIRKHLKEKVGEATK